LTFVDATVVSHASMVLDVLEDAVSRVQLALNVADLEASIAFYSKLFGVGPAKVRDGYANFAVADLPLKLVLFAGGGEPGSLNHLGVEVDSSDEVMAAAARARGEELPAEVEESTTCCYAVQDKVWVQGPDNAWEFYTVLADAPVLEPAEARCAEEVADAVPAERGCCA
jgi:catechol 2,3-dioxygenase-like lactoylglutathione lyase family enzyme